MHPGPLNLITDVAGLRVGNAMDPVLESGTTVLLADVPLVASVAVQGGAPGTRETDLLYTDKSAPGVDASALPVFEGSAQFGVSGGTGFDEIEITVGAGPSDSSAWAGDNVTVLADGTIQVKVGSVDDFDPDEDSLTIVDNGADDGFSLTGARIEESVSIIAGKPVYLSSLHLTYTSDSGSADRELVIDLPGASNLSAVDIVVRSDSGLVNVVTAS